MEKKLLALALVLVISLLVAACGVETNTTEPTVKADGAINASQEDEQDGDDAFYSSVFEATMQPCFTNVLDDAGIVYNKYLSGDGSEVDTTAALCVTGYIPITKGQIVRMSDFALTTSGTPSVCLYTADYELIARIKVTTMSTSTYYFGDIVTDDDGYVVQFTVLKTSSLAYIRLCTQASAVGSDPVVTVDEEITWETGYGEKLRPDIQVDYSQLTNVPEKNGWNILPYEHLNIAYSSIGRKPINTVEHFTDAATNCDFNALKCDVRLTSDGELVCCHDAGFTFDSNGYITTYDSSNATVIHDVTAETCLSYSFSSGEHPCMVGDYLDVCRKYGKVAFITIRNEYMDEVIPKLISELKAHNMLYATIINSMTYESLLIWRTYDTDVMLNYTLSYGAAITSDDIDKAVVVGYCSLCGFSLSSASTTPSADCDFEYAREKGVRLLQAIAYAEGSPEACYDMGYDGCQIGYPWSAD